MRKTFYGIVVFGMLCCFPANPVSAEVSIGIGLPNVSIGINLPVFPELVPVPGYPVYYAPRLNTNYFFYDGMYWVYHDDYWYASYWYNGPWWFVEPEELPLFILRIPVRYYRSPPVYFRGWRPDAPPRWGQHWGRKWENHRRGWDKWRRSSVPARAPLPDYQRHYSGDRYPRELEQQRALRGQHYRYQPRDKAVRRNFQQQGERVTPKTERRGRQEEPRMRGPVQQDIQRQVSPLQQGGQSPRPEQRQPPLQQRGPAVREQRTLTPAVEHERQPPRPQRQEQRLDRGRQQEQRGQGEERREEGRGRER